jgi:hypothetical protein
MRLECLDGSSQRDAPALRHRLLQAHRQTGLRRHGCGALRNGQKVNRDVAARAEPHPFARRLAGLTGESFVTWCRRQTAGRCE